MAFDYRLPARKRPLALAAALLLSGTAHAQIAPATLPTQGQFTAGSGTITQTTPSTLQVTQTTGRGIVEWGTFSIGSGAWVNFTQPSASSVTLNRVMGSDPSRIFGRMTANGQVFLTNPSGVLFAPGAAVDVGGLFATTLSIANQDFLAGRYNFYNAGGAGSVVNQGHIITTNGYAALAGPQVRNDGVIVARAGMVALAAGNRVSLDMVGDGLISVSVDAAAANASAINSGRIEADGGRVVLTARSANALLDTVVNNEGIIRAHSLVERNGEIVLDGGRSGVTLNGGRLEALGLAAGTRGGTIKVLGDKVGLVDAARLDASGDAGGGTILVGGNWQGGGPEQSASLTYVSGGSRINADAGRLGDGGKVVVWADGATHFYGSISARGGAAQGDGGSVEVSGKNGLAFHGDVDTRAPAGKTGSLLLDPDFLVVIDDASGAGQHDANFTGTNPVGILSSDANQSLNTVTDGRINQQLQMTDVVLEATGHIRVKNGTSINLSGNHNLMLKVANTVTDPEPSLTLETGSVIANLNPTDTGRIYLRVEPGVNAGNVSLGGSLDGASGGVLVQTPGTITVGGATQSTGSSGVIILEGGAVNLNAATTAAQTYVKSGGGIGVDAAVSGGQVALHSAGSGAITMGASGSISGSDVYLRADAGAITLRDITASGVLQLKSTGGDITQAGGSLTAASMKVVSDSNVTLTQAANTIGTIAASITGAGKSFSYANDPGLAVGSVTTGGFTVNPIFFASFGYVVNGVTADLGTVTGIAASGGGIGLNASGALSVNQSITTSGAGAVTLAATGNGNGISVATGRTISSSGGAIDLSSAADITLNGTATVASSGAGTVTLNAGQGSDTSGAITTGAGALQAGAGLVTLNAETGIAAGTTASLLTASNTSSGNVAITDAAGGLTIGGSGVANAGTGTTSLTATGGTLLVSQPVVSGGSVALAGGAATIDATVDTGGGLSITTDGAISGAGKLLVAGNTSLSAGAANDIFLISPNRFGGTVSLASGNNVTLRDTQAFDLGATTVSGNLMIRAAGAITDSGNVSVGGNAFFVADGHSIILGDTTTANFGSLRFTGAAVTITEGSAMVLSGTSTASSAVLGTGGAGSITDLGKLVVTGTTSLAAGAANDIVLDRVNDFGGAVSIVSGNNVTLRDSGAIDLGAMTVSGNLVVRSVGAISNSGNVSVSGNAHFNSAGNPITLGDTTAANFGSLTFVGGAVSVTEGSAMVLSGTSTASSAVLGTGGAGSITDLGKLVVTGTTSLAAGAAHDIVLDGPNHFGGAVSIVSGNNVTLRDTGAIDLGAVSVSGNLVVRSVGAISDSGNVSVSGNAYFNSAGNPITLGDTTAANFDSLTFVGGAVSVTEGSAMVLSGTSTASSAVLGTGGAGSITDLGKLVVTGTTSLAAGAANDIVLDGPNHFGGAVSIVSGNNVTLRDTGAIDLGAVTVSGNLVVRSVGAISDSGDVSVSGNAYFNSAGNPITLGDTTAANFGSLRFTGAAVNITEGSAMVLSGTSAASSAVLGTGGAGGITDLGKLSVSGTTSLAGGAANDIVLDGINDFGGAISVVSGKNVTLRDTGALVFGTSTISGDLVVNAVGAITGGANVSVGGTVTLTSPNDF